MYLLYICMLYVFNIYLYAICIYYIYVCYMYLIIGFIEGPEWLGKRKYIYSLSMSTENMYFVCLNFFLIPMFFFIPARVVSKVTHTRLKNGFQLLAAI